MQGKSLIVVGGGAAGFFCAVNAARLHPGLQVALLEKTSKLLSKVKVSGGGRCNVTHACYDIVEMSKRYPRGSNFVKKTFHQFFTTDTIEWFEERGVKLKTEKDGRMFPVTDSSQSIINCLLQEADKYNVRIQISTEVKQISRREIKWELETSAGERLSADYVCIACGGYTRAAQFEWLQALGHSIEIPVPSLFTFNMPGNPVTALMGVSVEETKVRIASTKLESTGPLLITHWGMSGPAILKLSAWGARELQRADYTFTAIVNWLPAFTEHELREKFQQLRYDLASQKIVNRNPFGLPQRLWEFMLTQAQVKPDTRWADLPVKEQNILIRDISAGPFSVRSKTTFKEEFVTAGGIRLQEIDHHTMMSRKQPGLYFAGEIIDVDAVTGGFNFQHAWTSGYIVAKNLGEGTIGG